MLASMVCVAYEMPIKRIPTKEFNKIQRRTKEWKKTHTQQLKKREENTIVSDRVLLWMHLSYVVIENWISLVKWNMETNKQRPTQQWISFTDFDNSFLFFSRVSINGSVRSCRSLGSFSVSLSHLILFSSALIVLFADNDRWW